MTVQLSVVNAQLQIEITTTLRVIGFHVVLHLRHHQDGAGPITHTSQDDACLLQLFDFVIYELTVL